MSKACPSYAWNPFAPDPQGPQNLCLGTLEFFNYRTLSSGIQTCSELSSGLWSQIAGVVAPSSSFTGCGTSGRLLNHSVRISSWLNGDNNSTFPLGRL